MHQSRLSSRFVRQILLVICTVIITYPAVALAQAMESYAVMDLEARGVSTQDAAILTDRMRSELVKTGAVTVVERGQMQQILSEQNFQMTGCTSDECAVEIGQMLGVTKMIAGSIGVIGSTYTVDLRVVNVGTGAIEETMTRNYRGEIDGLLEQVMYISWEMVGMVHPDEAVAQLQAEPSGLQLEDVTAAPAQEPATQPTPSEPRAEREKKGGKRLLLVAAVAAIGGGGYLAYTMMSEEPEPPGRIGPPPNFPELP